MSDSFPLRRGAPHSSVHDVLEAIDTMSPRELDGLPYGMIQLDRSGRVLNYNAVESKLASLRKEDAIGKQFFTEIAPCTRVQEFYGRFTEGVIRESLDTSFRFHFAFKQSPRDVTVRLLYSKRTRTVWVMISDHEGKPLDGADDTPAGDTPPSDTSTGTSTGTSA